MLQGEVLVLEFVAVDGFASGAVVVREVAALAHEVGDDAMEGGALVAVALLAGAQGTEVLACLRYDIGAKLKRAEKLFLISANAMERPRDDDDQGTRRSRAN